MIVDGLEVRDGAVLETDVCVIGGGAAGIAACLPFIGGSSDVVLLEAGGEGYAQASQAWYAGDVDGDFPGSALTGFRLRQFGGTTGHWEGQVFPLDPIDFRVRPWVRNSGWPIAAADLTPHYEAAARLMELPAVPNERLAGTGASIAARFLGFLPEFTQHHVFQVAPLRFAERFGPDLRRARNVNVYLNARVDELTANDGRDRVVAARVRTEGGRSFRVAARTFVLAAGALENARLLLYNRLGTDHDVVGRYFFAHSLLTGCHLYADFAHREALEHLAGFNDDAHRFFVRIGLASAAQERHQLMNCHVGIDAVTTSEFEALPAVLFRGRDLDPDRLVLARLRVLAEQEPDATNRITLSDTLDELGIPQLRIRWRYGERDLETVRRTLEVLGRDLAAHRGGRVHVPDVEAMSGIGVTPGHHMGATRMSIDPHDGVVDANCRMHGVDNVYLAGSSVFPTGGAANPTFTVVALSLRLAQHLQAALRSQA
jgi:choline dehydrogenase-like flavoprotein